MWKKHTCFLTALAQRWSSSLLLLIPLPRCNDTAPPRCGAEGQRLGNLVPGRRLLFSNNSVWRRAGLSRGEPASSATPAKAQGLQTPCPLPIVTGSFKPVNISSRILYIRISATEHECHSFVLLCCCETSVAKNRGWRGTQFSLCCAPNAISSAHTLVCLIDLLFFIIFWSSFSRRQYQRIKKHSSNGSHFTRLCKTCEKHTSKERKTQAIP